MELKVLLTQVYNEYDIIDEGAIEIHNPAFKAAVSYIKFYTQLYGKEQAEKMKKKAVNTIEMTIQMLEKDH